MTTPDPTREPEPCSNVDQFGQVCQLIAGHAGNHCRIAKPREPEPADDLVRAALAQGEE